MKVSLAFMIELSRTLPASIRETTMSILMLLHLEFPIEALAARGAAVQILSSVFGLVISQALFCQEPLCTK